MKQTLLATLVALVALVALGAQCERVPDPILPTDTEQCPAACENLRRLGCEEGDPILDQETGGDVPCEIFCADTQGNGHALNPTCMARITSCDQVDLVTSDPDFCRTLLR